METKNIKEKLDTDRTRMKFQAAEYVEPVEIGGGLALWWKNVDVKILQKGKNIIDPAMVDHNGQTCRVTRVYTDCDFHKRQGVWNELERRISKPWICIGNFNNILRREEK